MSPNRRPQERERAAALDAIDAKRAEAEGKAAASSCIAQAEGQEAAVTAERLELISSSQS
jgi:hypothetical protein